MTRFAINRFALLGLALGLPAFAAAQATQTRISTETHDVAGRTQARVSIAVEQDGGSAATGAVVVQDGAQTLAGAALDSDGKANISVDLQPGPHNLRALYKGDAANKPSVSQASVVAAQTSTTPDFTVAVNPADLTLTAGQSGTVAVSVVPVNASSLAAPIFVTLACSGLPDQSSCSFTPENVEILPTSTAAIPSSMVVTTQSAGTRGALQPSGNNSTALALLLPGTLILGGMAFAARRRRWLSRLSLIALLGFVATLGTTACAPRYNYYNHGPPYNLPTPAGTYTVTLSAQSSNGVTATTHTTTLALTVK